MGTSVARVEKGPIGGAAAGERTLLLKQREEAVVLACRQTRSFSASARRADPALTVLDVGRNMGLWADRFEGAFHDLFHAATGAG